MILRPQFHWNAALVLGVEVFPAGGALMWALRLGPLSITLTHRWWL